ncbi:MAG TPA: hypothetical protein VIN08_10935 [Ohtaekwangia sp.]
MAKSCYQENTSEEFYYIGLSITVATNGSGKYSIDQLIKIRDYKIVQPH